LVFKDSCSKWGTKKSVVEICKQAADQGIAKSVTQVADPQANKEFQK